MKNLVIIQQEIVKPKIETVLYICFALFNSTCIFQTENIFQV